MKLSEISIGFLGGGNMAEAIMKYALRAGFLPENISVSDIKPARRDELAQRYGVICTADNREVLARPLVVLAIKPQVLATVLPEFEGNLPALISIMAGWPVSKLRKLLPEGTRLLRVMPNMPAMVGEGMTAFSNDHNLTPTEFAWAMALFGSVGRVEMVEEKLMDTVTALIGSGPAFVSMFIEALADGAVREGLPWNTALIMAEQMLAGTAHALLETEMHPGQMKNQVSSPAGTTIEGVRMLEQAGLRSAVMEALIATAQRGREMV